MPENNTMTQLATKFTVKRKIAHFDKKVKNSSNLNVLNCANALKYFNADTY